MDPVTHTLTGIGLANAFYRKRMGGAAVIMLMIAANLPDIDVLSHLMEQPWGILSRRTFGHSLLMFPIWSAVLAGLFWLKWRSFGYLRLYGLCLAGAALHVCFDLINSFGVVLLWPLSDWRPELGIVFIVDLLLTGILVAPVILTAPPSIRHRLPKAARWCWAIVAFYILSCGANRALASRRLAQEAARLGIESEFSYVFPEPFGCHRWRGVLLKDGVYHLFLIHAPFGGIEKKGTLKSDTEHPAVVRARASETGRRLEWFFKAPVWSAEGGEAQVHDLRFRSLVLKYQGHFQYRFSSDGKGLGWRGRIPPK